MNYYDYNRVPPLSEEDLKAISKKCEITLYVINDGDDDTVSDEEYDSLDDMTLDDFLLWRDSRSK